MNNPSEIKFGIATSAAQHETPLPGDFEFFESINREIEKYPPEEALKLILSPAYGFDSLQSPLKDIGLNLTAIRNLVQGLYNNAEYNKAITILRSIVDIVFDKYINILKLLNLKLLRISLNWSIILTEDYKINPTGINNYRRKCIKLLENGIEPIITFSHFETAGLDIHSPRFEEIFTLLSTRVLDRLVEVDVKYFIPFNEPAVHSAGLNFGLWGGDGKFSAGNLVNHLKTLNRIGYLSKVFYKNAQKVKIRYGKDVQIIANFNIALLDYGTKPTAIDKAAVWIINKFDKDAQINPFKFENGEYAFDMIALNPYNTFRFEITNRVLRILSDGFLYGTYLFTQSEPFPLNEKITQLIASTTNPDFSDSEETREGMQGEILYPKAIGKVIRDLRERTGIKKFVVTETGANISENNIKDKTWYLKKVKQELLELEKEKISIPFALIWTLIRMWEIVGPEGGGIRMYNFAMLGEPLHEEQIKERLIGILDMNDKDAKEKARELVRNGNTPFRIYEGMIDELADIFGAEKISAKQFSEAVTTIIDDGNAMVVNILQIYEIRNYFDKKGDTTSVEYLNSLLKELITATKAHEATQETVEA